MASNSRHSQNAQTPQWRRPSQRSVVDPNKCKHGEECCKKGCYFNHPNRDPCRNGQDCFRVDCYYNHEIITCRFLDKCTNATCAFRHPSHGATSSGSGSSTQNTSAWDSFATTKDARFCKWGAECHTKGCYFNHPNRTECGNRDACFHKLCPYNHETILCSYVERCRNRECKFRHPPKPTRARTNSNQSNLPPPVENLPQPCTSRSIGSINGVSAWDNFMVQAVVKSVEKSKSGYKRKF